MHCRGSSLFSWMVRYRPVMRCAQITLAWSAGNLNQSWHLKAWCSKKSSKCIPTVISTGWSGQQWAGSIIAPLLEPVGDILFRHNIMLHGYADDTQMYCYFNPRDPISLQGALRSTECCLDELVQWMVMNKLKLNAQKTEFIIFTPVHLRPLVDQLQPVFRVGDALISPSSVVRNLGVLFDSGLTMLPHISRTVQGVFGAIKNISRIRRYLDDKTCAPIVQALAISTLEYANSLLVGLPKCALRRLRVAQNSAARLVSRVSGRTRITPVLKHLHWLPVHLRAEYKLLSIVFSALNTNTAPIYLRDLVKENNRRTLRSNSSAVKLDVARTIRKTGERAFAVCASSRWNSLPAELRQCDSLASFKRQLKTHIFNVFFNVNDVSDDTGCWTHEQERF